MKYLVPLFLFVFSTSLFSQVGNDEYFSPFSIDTWIFGIAGNAAFDNNHADLNSTGLSNKSNISNTSYNINSRNGRMLFKNVAVGMDLQWSNNNQNIKPDPNPTNAEQIDYEVLGFIGLWGRFYQPFANDKYALFGEFSIGYLSYHDESNNKGNGQSIENHITDADGLGYNLGLGASLFATKHVAFELTARYELGELTGKTTTLTEEELDFKINQKRINLLLGIQVYL
ncbi:MAG: hypothetical protein RO257_18110 [Candidatus Kapabacteria bacterium]|nr:hypothetical protein [Candidatus Kapabacteria bacterium]